MYPLVYLHIINQKCSACALQIKFKKSSFSRRNRELRFLSLKWLLEGVFIFPILKYFGISLSRLRYSLRGQVCCSRLILFFHSVGIYLLSSSSLYCEAEYVKPFFFKAEWRHVCINLAFNWPRQSTYLLQNECFDFMALCLYWKFL